MLWENFIYFLVVSLGFLSVFWTMWIRDCCYFICLSDLSTTAAPKHSTICNKHRPIHLISCFEPVNMVLELKFLNPGESYVSHFHVCHFWCWVFKEMGLSIQQERIPSSSDINNIPNITPITWGRRNGSEHGNDARVACCQGRTLTQKLGE